MGIQYQGPRSEAIALAAVTCLALGGSSAYARLGPSQLAELLRDSEVIVQGTVLQTQEDGTRGGSATIRVTNVYKGSVAKGDLKLSWTLSDLDQRIDSVGRGLLLFLRRDANRAYVATQEGRSYWPLYEELDGFQMVTPYVYPTETVIVKEKGLVRSARIWIRELPSDRNPVKVDAIYVADIVRLISGR